ncbi:hypothetical protein RN001_009795 [Aquatica leii]|uniref:Uncharacterized protein n=1 Tax=Aquatica leii TaxID=1421715 RepID=A0AAN7SFT3_9COLE|nr:hypothetical protein RN001_009795 [Aquatica leii]
MICIKKTICHNLKYNEVIQNYTTPLHSTQKSAEWSHKPFFSTLKNSRNITMCQKLRKTNFCKQIKNKIAQFGFHRRVFLEKRDRGYAVSFLVSIIVTEFPYQNIQFRTPCTDFTSADIIFCKFLK